jgi:hypothetical protein
VIGISELGVVYPQKGQAEPNRLMPLYGGKVIDMVRIAKIFSGLISF